MITLVLRKLQELYTKKKQQKKIIRESLTMRN